VCSATLGLAQQLIRLRSLTPQHVGRRERIAQGPRSIAPQRTFDTLKSICRQARERLLLPA